ncbi:PPW family C-terminal domain-containing PPE protein [Mycolicibacter algericus]|uniref:PPW family C-terminal domain-containing PPE protein n=1 Tax=Mycolicibacter algericus TaxID=1288388 RepID=UPI0021F35112|nr:hypothetical protein [Mycolicibacter algericus]
MHDGGAHNNDTATSTAGLTTLNGDTFASGPTMPMMPASWSRDAEQLSDTPNES